MSHWINFPICFYCKKSWKFKIIYKALSKNVELSVKLCCASTLFSPFCWALLTNTNKIYKPNLATVLLIQYLQIPCQCELTSNNLPPQCSSHTVKSVVLLAKPGSMLLHSMTMAWGIIMMQETIQMMTILFRARLAVLLNIKGWQIAYHLSKAMQLNVRTDTDTDTV